MGRRQGSSMLLARLRFIPRRQLLDRPETRALIGPTSDERGLPSHLGQKPHQRQRLCSRPRSSALFQITRCNSSSLSSRRRGRWTTAIQNWNVDLGVRGKSFVLSRRASLCTAIDLSSDVLGSAQSRGPGSRLVRAAQTSGEDRYLHRGLGWWRPPPSPPRVSLGAAQDGGSGAGQGAGDPCRPMV